MTTQRTTSGSFIERLKGAMLKPADPTKAAPAKTPAKRRSVEELEAEVHSADDKERLIGLLAGPFAAIIGIMVISALITNDPAALLRNGQPNKLHVNVSLYHDLLFVLLGLSVAMVAAAWFRKRMFLAIVMALYGLAVFNLHYWGFGVPFIMVGAWLLVRAYRLQKDLKEATGNGVAASADRPSASKRYTPPVVRTRASR
jgi:hypothetical protein